jgi:uncharacterized protein (TIGR02118 family)
MTTRVRRRQLLKAGSIAIVAGLGASGLHLMPAAWADAGISRGTAKMVFVLFRRAGLSHDQCLNEWKGERHVSLVKNVPGLRRWVQNHIVSPPNESAPDGLGELWFDDPDAMKKAMGSPEMGAAVEDAKRFLDMAKTYALTVDENVVVR